MPTFVTGPVEVSVPATSANLGPGFDSLGLALDFRDRVTAQVTDAGLDIAVRGTGEGEVPLDENHLVYSAMCRAFDEMGCAVPGIRLHCENRIPHGRGLGSSSAAIVAGICAARGLVAGGSLLMDDDAVFDLAARMEGHPDNVAPAFYGGFTIARTDGDHSFATMVSVDPRVTVVVFVPPEPVETKVARGLLPDVVPHADAAANAGRAALLVTALSRQPELLLAATEDRLHQRYREPAMPRTLAFVDALRAVGVPAVVSGAGPTVLAFSDASNQESLTARVPDGWRVRALSIDLLGAQVNVGE
ncbi:MAG TPA: homoserine kinase [Nocardioidaceae bacterium]|nr:homoserine kinase [Nocardioidaceae bacterium]